MINFIVVFIAA